MSPDPAPLRAVRRSWPWLRLAGGAVFLMVLVARFGTGPFVEAWRVTSWPVLGSALALSVMATLACVWRWRVVSARLGVPLQPWAAVTAYYRSQFLNATLPGGFLGDAHRAVRHGRAAGDVPAGLRAAFWDRLSGQLVQVGLAFLALVALASPLRQYESVAVLVVALIGVVGWSLYRRGSRPGSLWVSADLRALVDAPAAARIATTSCVSSAGHVGVFLVAANAVGVDASVSVLVPAALVVLVLSAVPINVAGWGPREGVTVWAFSAVGLGSADGLTVSVVYGVLATVATLPGAVVLLGDAVARRRARNGQDGGESLVPVLEEVPRG
jgi:uncharacterized membrane protein YbhN (UPF0104 family)